jgi:ATP-dependent DNA helicase Rep
VSYCNKRKRGRGKAAQSIVCEPSRFIAEMGLDAPVQQMSAAEKPDPRAMFANLKAMLAKP